MEWHHMTSPRKNTFMSVSSAGKIMVTVFGMRKVLFLCNFLPRGTKVNSNHHTETLRSLNVHLCRVHPTRKMSSVLLYYGNARPHTSLCTTEAITDSGWTLSPLTLHSWPCPIILSVCSFEKSLWGHNYANDEALQNTMCQWLQRRDRNFYQVEILFFKGGRILQQRWQLHWKITMPSGRLWQT